MADWFYDGADLRVRTRLFPQSAQTVLTFTGRNARPPVEQGFGETFFLKRRVSAIHFISKANHWWQTAEVGEAIARLRAAGLLEGPLVLYGSSMGGYAVLRYSAELRPQRVVAVSPQFSIDPRRVPFETRWQHYAARLDFRHDDMAAGLDREAQVLVLVDPQFPPDRRHVALVERIRPVELLPLAFAGHNTARALEEVGLVSGLLSDLLAGSLDRRAPVRQWRCVRRHSALAWHGLAERLEARGQAGHATLAATIAAAQLQASGGRMRDTALQVEIHAHAARLACADGHEALARRCVRELAALAPAGTATLQARAALALAFGDAGEREAAEASLGAAGDAAGVALRARLLCALGRAGAACELLRQAAAQGKPQSQALLQAALARACLAAGRADAAVAAAEAALAADPAHAEARMQHVLALRASGRQPQARAALEPLLGRTLTAIDVAEPLAAAIHALWDKQAATALRARTRRARWLQELLLQELATLAGPDAGWLDRTLALLRARAASRLRRLEAGQPH